MYLVIPCPLTPSSSSCSPRGIWSAVVIIVWNCIVLVFPGSRLNCGLFSCSPYSGRLYVVLRFLRYVFPLLVTVMLTVNSSFSVISP